MFRSQSLLVSLLAVVALVSTPDTAEAAPVWVDRAITLPRHDWAFDVGLGLGHLNGTPSQTGAGLNIEGAVGVTGRLELGLRTGVRFGNDGRATQADAYGRLFDRQTFGTNRDELANPEFRIRAAIARGSVAEVALEGRAFLPIEDYSRFGGLFGVPIAFHLGQSARLDTGVYIPVVFYSEHFYAISVPLDVWIQVSSSLWLGPMTGFRTIHQAEFDRTDWSLGFGLGYEITRALDLKASVLMPGINHEEGARNIGAGVGLQFRIE